MVLDDETAERLRRAAVLRGMEVEQLIVDLLHAISLDLVPWPDEQGSADVS